jgi:hypothetical protein
VKYLKIALQTFREEHLQKCQNRGQEINNYYSVKKIQNRKKNKRKIITQSIVHKAGNKYSDSQNTSAYVS